MVTLTRPFVRNDPYPDGDASIHGEAREYMIALLLLQAAREQNNMVVRGHRPGGPSLTFGHRYAALNMQEVEGLLTIWRAYIWRVLRGRLKGGHEKFSSETSGLPNYAGIVVI